MFFLFLLLLGNLLCCVKATIPEHDFNTNILPLLYGGPPQTIYACPSSGAVKCSPQGHITSISLPSSGLSGVLPTELGLLSRLELLNVAYNQLSSTIPSEIGIARGGIQFMLNVANNRLSGTIPPQVAKNSVFILAGRNRLTGTLPAEMQFVTGGCSLTVFDAVPSEENCFECQGGEVFNKFMCTVPPCACNDLEWTTGSESATTATSSSSMSFSTHTLTKSGASESATTTKSDEGLYATTTKGDEGMYATTSISSTSAEVTPSSFVSTVIGLSTGASTSRSSSDATATSSTYEQTAADVLQNTIGTDPTSTYIVIGCVALAFVVVVCVVLAIVARRNATAREHVHAKRHAESRSSDMTITPLRGSPAISKRSSQNVRRAVASRGNVHSAAGSSSARVSERRSRRLSASRSRTKLHGSGGGNIYGLVTVTSPANEYNSIPNAKLSAGYELRSLGAPGDGVYDLAPLAAGADNYDLAPSADTVISEE